MCKILKNTYLIALFHGHMISGCWPTAIINLLNMLTALLFTCQKKKTQRIVFRNTAQNYWKKGFMNIKNILKDCKFIKSHNLMQVWNLFDVNKSICNKLIKRILHVISRKKIYEMDRSFIVGKSRGRT